MSTPAAGYDPLPALAALIDGIRAMARDGTDAGIQAQLMAVLVGPYASLRAGLELYGADWETAGAEAALRKVLAVRPVPPAETSWGPCSAGNHRDCAIPGCPCPSAEPHAGPHPADTAAAEQARLLLKREYQA